MTSIRSNNVNVVRNLPQATAIPGTEKTANVSAEVKTTAKADVAPTGDRFELASARGGGTRPTASHPKPGHLANTFHGQVGASSNRTGKIGGAAELAQFVNAGYNGGRFGPVSITPATLREGNSSKPVHLVGISGTEAVDNQSTGWITNLKAGFEQNNPGLRNARDAILRT
ncbi:MAG TPA: hypothetical protein VEU33_45760, partial [Archangium sp.]|nr:hypothetical protein [Archangium sp.]